MPVTREQVEQMAALARLRLSDDEIATFTTQLGDILDHAEELADMSVDAGQADLPEVPSRLRVDEPGRDELLAEPGTMAPMWNDGFFTLPRLPAMDGGEDPADD